MTTLLGATNALWAAEGSQSVTVSKNMQIPGAVLKPGTYAFSVEDRLPDRAIVRIANPTNGDEHYLVMAVPNPGLTALDGDQLAYFRGANDAQTLKAWKCSSCVTPLEFVYPKLEAVKITDDSAEPVLAVDPAYDKLPNNLTDDDMKVVSLWLVSPERVTADHLGQGVKAAKYTPDALASAMASAPEPVAPAPAASASTTQPVAAPAAAPAPTAPTASASAETSPPPEAPVAHPRRTRLPKTAGHDFEWGALGLLLVGVGLGLRYRRLQRAV